MKNLKCIITLFLIFIASGCTVNYDIEINNNSIEEITSITENVNKADENILSVGVLTYRNYIDKLYSEPQAVYIDANEDPYNNTAVVEGVDYYSKTLISNIDEYGLKLDFKHSIDNYHKSSIITKCYKNISILNRNDILTISTSRNNLCFEQYKNLDKINISVTIDEKEYAVISSNADKIEDGKYYWEINRENYSNKSILIELEELEEVRKKQNAMYFLIGFMAVVGVIIGIVYLFIKRRSEDTNKI